MRAAEFIVETAMMGKIADSGKIIRILKKAHTVPFSDEKNWLLVDTDPGKGNSGLGIKWIPADTRFEWVRPYKDTVDENLSPQTIHKLADRKGVKWDNEPSFLQLTKRLTGKEHLDDLDHSGLNKVKRHLDGLQGVAEEVNSEILSTKNSLPTEKISMGDYEFNAQIYTGELGNPGLQIRAYDPKLRQGIQQIGNADFVVHTDEKGNTWLESDDTAVRPSYYGKGVAAMMYAFAKSLGNDIKPSPYQEPPGKKMWKKWGKDAKNLVGEQGVAEGSEQQYLWHGSRQKIPMLEPRQAVDTGGAAGSNQNAIYATSDPIFAIQMGMPTAGSDYGNFPNDPQMVLFSGKIRKGEYVYLHKLPMNGPDGKPQFVQGGNSREFHSVSGVEGIKPTEIKAVPVDKYLNLIRQATQQDLELRKKYMKQGVAEGLDEAVGGNYLYHSTQDANTAKQILSSGYLLGNSGGKQPASNAQTTLPTVSFGRSIGYQTTGANVDRDYQVVFVFDRTSIETRYKTLGTSQSQTVRGLANPIDTEWGRKVAKLGKVWGLDANADGKVDYKEIGNASKSTASNTVKQAVSTHLNAPKAGGEFEEIVPTKTGKIPLQGLLVGFYLVPGKAASKDPELLNDPRRLDMPIPNQFVKATQAQGVAEGSLNEFAQGNGGDDGEAFNPGLAKMAQEHGFTKGFELADGASLATAFKITEWDQQFGGLYKQHFVQGFKKGRMDKINFNNKQHNLNLKLMKDGSIIRGEQGVAEAKNLKKHVKIVKGPDAGKSGWIREIKHGLFKGAPKTYYIDLDGGGQANNLPATALRLVKDQGVAEASDRMQRYGQQILKRKAEQNAAAQAAGPQPKKEEPPASSDYDSMSTRDFMKQLRDQRRPKKKGVAEGSLNEFAPGSSNGGGDDSLFNYAKMWYNGDLKTQQQVEKALQKSGLDIGENEDENGGAYISDMSGDYYESWTAEDLEQGVTEEMQHKKITELFDAKTAFPLQWDNQFASIGEVHAEAYDADGRTIDISFTPTGIAPILYGSGIEIVFKRGGSYDMTGHGDAPRVLATVVNAISQYLQKYQPPYIAFSAKSTGGRAGAYAAMIRRLARGYKLLTPDEYPDDTAGFLDFLGSDKPFILARS